MTQEKREDLARIVENHLIKAAGCVRNRIIEGMNIDQAMEHESVQFWVKELDISNELLKAKD